jgi:hypothetical protein
MIPVRRKVLALFLVWLLSNPVWAGRTFNGTTNKAIVTGTNGSPIDLTGPQMAAACWFYVTSLPAVQADCLGNTNAGGTGGYQLDISQSGHANQTGVWFYISIPINHVHNFFCSTAITTNQWYLEAFAYQNNNNAFLYFGKPGAVTQCAGDGAVGSTGVLVSSGQNLNIGGALDNATFPLAATIAEVAVWNAYLTPAEMVSLGTECPNQVRPTALVGYWPLYGASGASIEPDLSGSKLKATLTGTTAVPNHPPCFR